MTIHGSQAIHRQDLSQPVAALYVDGAGAYAGLEGVDPWDEKRDARQYPGPWPVVAHPPCQRWGKLWAGQPLWIKRTGERKIKGDDGGCFKAALAAVRRWGGVLEHPWGSHAWPHFDLNKPPRTGGWIMADFHHGWTCCVEQGRYGHYARKPTLLYAVRADVISRDGYVCAYCQDECENNAQVDHIVPLSQGGTNDLDNLTVACGPCNSSKSGKTLEEWRGRYQ